MSDNIAGVKVTFDCDNMWERPEYGESLLSKAVEEIAYKKAREIERKLMIDRDMTMMGYEMINGKPNYKDDITGTLSISIGNHKTRTVFCNYRAYNLNRKALIV